MYHVSAQGVDERMINVHYYYYYYYYFDSPSLLTLHVGFKIQDQARSSMTRAVRRKKERKEKRKERRKEKKAPGSAPSMRSYIRT